MSMAARGLLLAAMIALPGIAVAADVAEYRNYVCEPIEQKLTSYRVECPIVDGVILEHLCVCEQDHVLVDPHTKIVTVPPDNASPY